MSGEVDSSVEIRSILVECPARCVDGPLVDGFSPLLVTSMSLTDRETCRSISALPEGALRRRQLAIDRSYQCTESVRATQGASSQPQTSTPGPAARCPRLRIRGAPNR